MSIYFFNSGPDTVTAHGGYCSHPASLHSCAAYAALSAGIAAVTVHIRVRYAASMNDPYDHVCKRFPSPGLFIIPGVFEILFPQSALPTLCPGACLKNHSRNLHSPQTVKYISQKAFFQTLSETGSFNFRSSLITNI